MTSNSFSQLVRSSLLACFWVIAVGCGGSSSEQEGGTSLEPGTDGGTLPSGGGTTGSGPGQGGMSGAGGTVSTCGDPGFGCCAGNACKNGACCVSGICMGEGAACVGLGSGVCSAGACGTCGGPGLPCCGDAPSTGTCTAPSTRCNNGNCERCGSAGYACCAPTSGTAGVCNDANTICSGNLCVPCGTAGSACCPGNVCTGTGCCYNSLCVGENGTCGTSAGTCQAGRCSGCGNATQPCCSGGCYDGLLCKSGTCASCGGSGEACCPSSTAALQCKAGLALACSSSGADGLCTRCGSLGDICCSGRTCSEGCCSTATNRCLADTTGCQGLDASLPTDAPTSQCASGGAPCSALAHFTSTQVLDGKDDEFCNIPSFELNFGNAAKINEYNTTGGSYPERAVARVAWDAAGIHAFVRVYDNTFTPAKSADTLWNGDSVELMFSSSTEVTGLTSKDANTVHVIVSPPNASSVKDSSSSGTPTPLPSAEFVSGSDSTGYWVELNLPWPGTAPAAGAQIKFEMQLNAADGVTKTSDSQTRDAQAIYYLGTAPSTTTCASSSAIYPFCDDRLWCTTTLQP